MWLECLPLVQSLNATGLMPDCDTVTLVNGVAYPAFPPDGIGIPCFPYSADVAVPYSQADCPYPLSYTGESERPEDSCQLGCPAYIYGGEDEYWGSVAAIYMTTVPSMVLSFLMIITWLLNPAKRYATAHTLPLTHALHSLLCFYNNDVWQQAVSGGIDPVVGGVGLCGGLLHQHQRAGRRPGPHDVHLGRRPGRDQYGQREREQWAGRGVHHAGHRHLLLRSHLQHLVARQYVGLSSFRSCLFLSIL